MRIVLASASPARRRVLVDAGITPIVQVSNVDEEALSAQLGSLTPAVLSLMLAQAKAVDVAHAFAGQDDVVVVGCDSIFELDGIAYGKPGTAEVARERIALMRGRTGHLHTGHWVCHNGLDIGRTTTTSVTFADMTDEEIDAYVATGEPLEVAGAFTLDGRSAPFISGIDGDPGNVVGLSLPTLRLLLSDLGISWPVIWASA